MVRACALCVRVYGLGCVCALWVLWAGGEAAHLLVGRDPRGRQRRERELGEHRGERLADEHLERRLDLWVWHDRRRGEDDPRPGERRRGRRRRAVCGERGRGRRRVGHQNGDGAAEAVAEEEARQLRVPVRRGGERSGQPPRGAGSALACSVRSLARADARRGVCRCAHSGLACSVCEVAQTHTHTHRAQTALTPAWPAACARRIQPGRSHSAGSAPQSSGRPPRRRGPGGRASRRRGRGAS